MTPPTWTEDARLAALRRYEILDTAPEPLFDDAVGLVKTICQTPIALVSLVDDCRQWFKAKVGVDAEQTGLDTSVCALAIQQEHVFVIEDLSADPRTAAMSLVTGPPELRFYAGVPLVTSDGFPLGSLCAIDVVPRRGGLSEEQTVALKALGRQVTAQIELRTAISGRDRATAEQERRQAQATRDSAVLQAMLAAQQQMMQSSGELAGVLQALVDAALAAVPAADGVVIEVRDGDDLVYHTTSGSSAAHLGARVPIRGSLSGRALLDRTTQVAVDARDDPRVAPALIAQFGIESLVAVPISRHGQAFGVLKLHAHAVNAFRSRDILIGQMLAGLVSASFTEHAEVAALETVAATEQSYRHIIDSAIDSAIISTDAAGTITSWSQGAERIMGWNEREMLGESLDRIFVPEDRASGQLARELEAARLRGQASDARWQVRRDGSRFFAHGTVTPLLGSNSGFVKSLRDVTDEHANKTALEASRSRLDAALDTGLIAFFSWDVVADRVTGDARFAEFYGFSPEVAAAGLSVAEAAGAVFPADAATLGERIAERMASSADYSHLYRTMRSDGGTRWMRVRGHCIERDGDRPRVYVGTAVDVTAQVEAEAGLRLSRERLELATRAADLGSFDYMPQSGLLDWDDRCRELFGLKPGEPVSYEGSFLEGVHRDDRARVDTALAGALDPAGTGTFDAEYRTIGPRDGVERSVLAKGLALFADGVAVRLIGTVQDVTADRAARAVLREAEQRYRLAVRATNDAIWDWDLLRDQLLWNEALERRYGWTPERVAPNAAWWLARIHADDRARVERSLQAVIAGLDTDWNEDYRFERADGSHADVRDRGYVLRDADGKAVRMLGALLDQTDRKQIERELQRRNQSLETSVTLRTEELNRLWEISPDLLLVIDFDGVLQRVNPSWTRILGYAPEELVGHHVSEFIVPEDIDKTEAAYRLAAEGGSPRIENRYRHQDGSTRWFSWVAAPTERETYATGRHITAEKEAAIALGQAEEQLRQSQKVEAIGQLTGGVAHDFNNLLTVIRGSADLLRRPNLSDERRQRYVDAIADTADRATKLTNQLLAFARRSALQPEIFDVGANVGALRDMMKTLSGALIDVVFDLPAESCRIRADPSQFDTAIVNMAVNARDAMARQGTLTISVAITDGVPRLRGHAAVPGAFVALSIRDTGSGIRTDRLEHIFEPFFTTKGVGEGTGLGLSQVFGFAKQSGGEIRVESEEGKGTVFTLYLPRVASAEADRPAAAGPPAPASESLCILVVEDNIEVGGFATQALAELGHFTVLARDAKSALHKLTAGATTFDIVFSDVVMPGITGIELAHRVRSLYPELPVLLTSGYSSVLAAEGTHGFALLQKPYSIEGLSAAIIATARSAQR